MPPTNPLSAPGDAVTEAKAAARRQVRLARRQRRADNPQHARRADAEALARWGMQWLTERAHTHGRVRCVTAYESMATEPPMDHLVASLLEAGVRVLVPITLPRGELRWRDADPVVVSHPFGARPEESTGPTWGEEILAEVDAAFIPALAIGRDGSRLGQGGGYYDRAIPALRSSNAPEGARVKPVIAVVYADDLLPEVPTHPHDIRVDAVLTPEGTSPITPGAATT
ncbi:MAG: 5-formyltetrahydrofolate cyclo-ligase [Ornithinimicrobium sp.]